MKGKGNGPKQKDTHDLCHLKGGEARSPERTNQQETKRKAI